MKRLLLTLCVAAGLHAQTEVMGRVLSKSPDSITLTTEDGKTINLPITPDTRVLRVPPGDTNRSNGTTVGIGDVNAGDRVVAQTNQVVVISRSEQEVTYSAERGAWQSRGVAGRVAEVAADSFTIVIPSGHALKVVTSPTTVFRRFTLESVRFSDASPSNFAELKAGDQVRILGDIARGTVAAEAVVSGAFRTFAGTIISVNAAAGEITLSDLETKTPVTVKVNGNSSARRMPIEMAQMLAARAIGPVEELELSRNTPPGASPVGERPPNASPQATIGRSQDLGQMLDSIPALTLAELKPGDALLVASTAGTDTSRATAISLLAGVEPLLTGPPSDRRLSGRWSLSVNMAP